MANHEGIPRRSSIGTQSRAPIQVLSQTPNWSAHSLKIPKETKLPKTTEERLKEITRPAVCVLLPVRDFLDDVMIRADGSYVAGFHLGGALSYFMDDEGRNQTKRTLESLFLTIPEESMRVQFRYEVIENVGSLLERYEAARTTTLAHVIAMDQQRVDEWRVSDPVAGRISRLVPGPGLVSWQNWQVLPLGSVPGTVKKSLSPASALPPFREVGRLRSRFWLGLGRYRTLLMKVVKAAMFTSLIWVPPIRTWKAALKAANSGLSPLQW